MHKSILDSVEEYVEHILRDRTPVTNHYHNLVHTRDIVHSSIEIGIGEKLSPDELEIVQIASWFHDIGYVENPKDHEGISAMYASNFLNEENYPEENIVRIIACILATKTPQNPKTKLEQVLCDADLNHFGKEDFWTRNESFRKEQEHFQKRKLNDPDFFASSINFMNHHHYHTDYAINTFSKVKKANIKELQNQLDLILNNPI
jgi:predicted metal-dependent HD superfamily phosphohydrolase